MAKDEIDTLNFHDSDLTQVNKKGKDVEFVISIDTHWFPGKKYGKLLLENCTLQAEFVKAWEKEDEGWLQNLEHMKKDRKHFFKLRFHNSEEREWIIQADEFDFKRVDEL